MMYRENHRCHPVSTCPFQDGTSWCSSRPLCSCFAFADQRPWSSVSSDRTLPAEQRCPRSCRRNQRCPAIWCRCNGRSNKLTKRKEKRHKQQQLIQHFLYNICYTTSAPERSQALVDGALKEFGTVVLRQVLRSLHLAQCSGQGSQR